MCLAVRQLPMCHSVKLTHIPSYWRHGAGVFRNSTAGEQPMDRCFFWLQGAGAHLHSTGVAQDKLLRTAVEHPELVRAVTPPEGASDNSAEAAEGSMQQERRTQQCTSAAQTALVLHRLVQSVASRAHRKLHSSPACPLLQISGESSQRSTCFDRDLSQGGLLRIRMSCLIGVLLAQCNFTSLNILTQMRSIPSPGHL